jgi:DNA polymerase phi
VFMSSLRQILLGIGTQSCSEKPKLSAAQLKDAFKLALVAVRQTKRVAPEALQETWKPTSWVSLKASLQSSPRFASSTAIHKQCDQVALLSRTEDAEGNGNAKKKRKAESESEVKTKTKSKKVKTKS